MWEAIPISFVPSEPPFSLFVGGICHPWLAGHRCSVRAGVRGPRTALVSKLVSVVCCIISPKEGAGFKVQSFGSGQEADPRSFSDD